MSKRQYSKEDVEFLNIIGSKLNVILSKYKKIFIRTLKYSWGLSFLKIYHKLKKTLENLYEGRYDDDLSKRIGKVYAGVYQDPEFVRSSAKGGIGTFVTIYLALYLISKGLEIKYKYRINENVYTSLVFSKVNNLYRNKNLLGLIVNNNDFWTSSVIISTDIPFLKGQELILGGGACPYALGEGKNILPETHKLMIELLDELYGQVLVQKINKKYRFGVPDYVKILRGDFEVDEEWLEKRTDYFEKN